MYRYDEFDHKFVQERTAQFRDQANRRRVPVKARFAAASVSRTSSSDTST